jgi:hypothetical protein
MTCVSLGVSPLSVFFLKEKKKKRRKKKNVLRSFASLLPFARKRFAVSWSESLIFFSESHSEICFSKFIPQNSLYSESTEWFRNHSKPLRNSVNFFFHYTAEKNSLYNHSVDSEWFRIHSKPLRNSVNFFFEKQIYFVVSPLCFFAQIFQNIQYNLVRVFFLTPRRKFSARWV